MITQKGFPFYLKRLVKTLYLWALTYFIFWIFNDNNPINWTEGDKFFCGLIMLLIFFVIHFRDEQYK